MTIGKWIKYVLNVKRASGVQKCEPRSALIPRSLPVNVGMRTITRPSMKIPRENMFQNTRAPAPQSPLTNASCSTKTITNVMANPRKKTVSRSATDALKSPTRRTYLESVVHSDPERVLELGVFVF